MVLYRRNREAGGTYFFTVALADRTADTLVAQVDLVREAFRIARARRPFVVEAVVVLPEHLHTIWTLPEGDTDYPLRWTHLKTHFSRALAARVPVSRNQRGEFGVWERRYWEHTIRDEADFARHCDYIHYNPVKHGLVVRPLDWPHSSFSRFVAAGIYPAEWGANLPEQEWKVGEPA